MISNDNIWRKLNYFQSATTTQTYLKKHYNGLSDADSKSYDNCYPFMFFLEQGESFFIQAASSPFTLKPILLFYGLIHLIKACILTVDPTYPNSTSVLAHGVTSRKRKKRHYHFFHDEVKIQKNGLFTHFAEHLFQRKHMEGEKYNMRDLLYMIPELDDLFKLHENKANIIMLGEDYDSWKIPNTVETAYYMDQNRLLEYLSSKSDDPINIQKNDRHELMIDKNIPISLPFRYHIWKQTVCLPAKPISHPLPDLLVIYMLLYNLSMISRYETEWWMELVKNTPNVDFPFIKTFMEVVEVKIPYLCLKYLENDPLTK